MKTDHHTAIEPLEARIAPAATFTFADVDGDFVTIKTSKGTDGELNAILTLAPEGLGMEIREIEVPRIGDKQADAIALTTAVFAVFEAWIRAHPEQWMWWNTRWVRPEATDAAARS